MNLLDSVYIIADKYHNQIVGQKRKYTGEKYTVHCQGVEKKYAEYFPNDTVGRAAAVAHDFFEDTPLNFNKLLFELEKLGVATQTIEVKEFVDTVEELTDVFTHEKFPHLNRAERKELERIRLSKTPVRARNIKIADILDNTKSIVENDEKFARVYLIEVFYLLYSLQEGTNQDLWNETVTQVRNGLDKLQIKI